MARKPRTGSIYLRGDVWWLKFHCNGQVFRESSHSADYADAERLLKRRQGEIVTGRFSGLAIERIRMSELFDQLVEDYRLNGRASLPQLESRLKVHLRPAFGDVRAAEFGSDHIKRYVVRRVDEGAANATLNRELEAVERALSLATQSDPPKVLRAVHIPMLPEINTRVGFLDDEGYLCLRQELPDYLRPVFIVAYHVGNRLGELRQLEWPQVDFKNSMILLRPATTKTKRGRSLPIYGDMGPVLLMEKEILGTTYPDCRHVFQRQGKPLGDFRKDWAAACARAGVPGLLFHDLRRSAIRNMRLAGIPENVAMEISGHRTRSVFDRYNIVGTRDLKAAAEKMNARFQTSTGTILGTIAKETDRDGTEPGHTTVRKTLN